MLRVFVKTEKLTEIASNSEVGTLSNYHIKTLMLWACELKPKSWWTDDLNLVRICVELLRTLAVWLNETRCKHYFIRNCNLFDSLLALKIIGGRLQLIDRGLVASWFVTNYINPAAHTCPESVSRLFDDKSTTANLENAVSAIVDWRMCTTILDYWIGFDNAKHYIAHYVSESGVCAPSCLCWTLILLKSDACLSFYFTAIAFLHVAHKFRRGGLDGNLMEALPVIMNE